MSREPVIRTEEADAIMKASKQIAETVKWIPDRQGHGGYRVKLRVFVTGFDEPLMLYGQRYGRRWSFSLNYLQARLRSLDNSNSSHRNPGNGQYFPPGTVHKHAWTTEYGDQEAYLPDDIDEESADTAFTSFLDESCIVLKTPYRAMLGI